MLPSMAMWMPGGGEWIIILVIALLLFGRRLPEVGRSLGQGLVEFKKGLRGITDEVDSVKRDVHEAGTAAAPPPNPVTSDPGQAGTQLPQPPGAPPKITQGPPAAPGSA